MKTPSRVSPPSNVPVKKGWQVSLESHANHSRTLAKAHSIQVEDRAKAPASAELFAEHERFKIALEQIADGAADVKSVAAAVLGWTKTREELEQELADMTESSLTFLQILDAVRTGRMNPSDIPDFEGAE